MKSGILIPAAFLAAIAVALGFLVVDHHLRASSNAGLYDIFFPEYIPYEDAQYSYVSIQRSCADYYVPEFANVSQRNVDRNPILRDAVSGETGDGLPKDPNHTRVMLNMLEQTPDRTGKGSFGINYDGKSYFLRYAFTESPLNYIDHVIGCYRDGLISHFENEEVVKQFKRQYGNDVFANANDDYVSYSQRDQKVYSAILRLYFDEGFDIIQTKLGCYVYGNDSEYEITGYDETVQHLQNNHCLHDKFPYVNISINEFRTSYSTGSTVDDFAIKLEGYYPTYNTPDISLQDEAGIILWTNYDDIGHVYTSRTGPVDFCKEYRFKDIGSPLTLNNTGTYKIVFSFEEFSFERTFYVRDNILGPKHNSPDFSCNQK